jgi:SAM-dependent methyltransferase
MRIPVAELPGKLVLDAGCGNGSQSVAYSRYGCEVVAVDLSSGVEHGQIFRRRLQGAVAERVHFVQADLRQAPFAPATFDVIHSAGVLHHTPDTRRSFEALAPLLRPEGTFYVWLYKYEKVVTPLVNALRLFTTPIPANLFARIARIMAPAFQGFCAATNALGIRAYASPSRKEAALALMDIFGAPYAHYHSFEEVASWYRDQGIVEPWLCNESRRGFGVCGRLAPAALGSQA